MNKYGLVILIFLLSIVMVCCEQYVEPYYDATMKAKWVEPQTIMPMIAISQMTYKATSRRFAQSFKEMNFSVIEKNQRYSYFLGKDVLKGFMGPEKLPEDLPLAEPTKDSFVIYAVANLDNDPDLDVWKIDQNRHLQHLRNDQ